jgi:hypothetical protein
MHLYGLIPAGQSRIPRLHVGRWQTPADPGRGVESTSQAEYAGSIPVIGSTSDVMKERGLRSLCPFRASMLGVLTLSTTKEAPCERIL